MTYLLYRVYEDFFFLHMIAVGTDNEIYILSLCDIPTTDDGKFFFFFRNEPSVTFTALE